MRKRARLAIIPISAGILCVFGLGLSEVWPANSSRVESVYRSVSQERDVGARIAALGAVFEGDPYLLGPLGEGEGARYDADPLLRWDRFDCTTFVETVLALALAPAWSSVLSTMTQIRYAHAEISFFTRNHFPEVDWVPNNIALGILRDVVREVAPGGVASVAEGEIRKGGWYRKLDQSILQVPDLTESEKERRLRELHDASARFAPEQARLPYLATEEFFLAPRSPRVAERRRWNQALADRVPSGVVVNVVRPHWDTEATQGTRLLVSHQALLTREGGELWIRHASSAPREHKIVKLRFEEFLRGMLNHPTIRGVQLLLVQRPRVRVPPL